ncbi:MAG: hypothetical protein H6606_03305 [Flavobacteriales bacterium]|nr:hypothetical protein [Flavobacteriales bacterium]
MDFIEIVAFIVGLLYFIFRANKKGEQQLPKNRPQSGEQSEQADERSLEDIFREIMQQQAPAPKVVRMEEEIKPPADERPQHSILNERRELLKIKRIEEEEEEVTPKVVVDFDLKQAVINDAILNRPY